MRALAILLLLGLVGCTPEIRPQFVVVPQRWAAPPLYIRLPEDVAEGDYRIDLVKELCKEFAVRLYDAFDGQIYVRHFVICNPSLLSERESGVVTLFQPDKVFIQHSETAMGNPPLRPGRSWVMMPMTMNGIKTAGGTMIHEWLHSYIGLGDEYKRATDRENEPTTSCPISPTRRVADSACIMFTADHRELCRPDNHNPGTDQGKESCYAFAARVLAESRLAFIKVPDHRIMGPFDPPTLVIEVRLK
jgi:hypothetical protein